MHGVEMDTDTGKNIRIERMTEEFIPQVAAIEAEIFSTPWSGQGFADALAMDHTLFYAALAQRQVVGYCGIYLAADEGEITNVAVHPQFRRRGIAWQLLRHMATHAFTGGTDRIFLEVRKSNFAAISLYTKFGFKNVGNRRNFYQNPMEDALVMMCESADIK